ncbi:hypothetical protein, partial [Cronobacter dublinensis]|uniref:hypothetical protein n=1 Tax=Cronobacter dublinensis TaxID=413497 RepID=UPI0018F8886A
MTAARITTLAKWHANSLRQLLIDRQWEEPDQAIGHLYEAALQLRGDAGPRQVKKPISASVVSAGGGSSMAGAALLRLLLP